MDVFYDKAGNVLGRAYSAAIKCKKTEDHPPHSHNPEHALHGPYMCSGVPETKLYTTPPRKPVN